MGRVALLLEDSEESIPGLLQLPEAAHIPWLMKSPSSSKSEITLQSLFRYVQ